MPAVSIDPRDPAFVRDPYPTYARLRAMGPCVDWTELGFPVFTRHPEVNALLRDRRFGRQVLHRMTREALGLPAPQPHLAHFDAMERHSLLELEPPAHTRIRAIVNKPFVPRSIERLEGRIEALAHELVDGFAARGDCDLLDDFARHLPVLVIAGFLGVPAAMAPQLLAWSHDIVAIYQVRRDRAIEDRAERATVEFSRWMRALVDERREGLARSPALRAEAEAGDVLSQLIAARGADGDGLSTDELVTTAILLLNAGHEATVHAIGNGVAALLTERPADGARAFLADPATVGEEMLRFDCPLQLFTRWVLEDVEVSGVRFAKGSRVGPLLGSANRDEARFPDGAVFDPARTPNPHVAFGAGIHACVGAPLARLELRTAVRVLFTRCPGLRLAEAPPVADTWHFRGLRTLRLRTAGT